MDEKLKNKLASIAGQKSQWNCPLCGHTSFHIGGPAEVLIEVESPAALQDLLNVAGQSEVLWRVIGRGTNLVVRDEGFPGIILILTGEFKRYQFEEKAHSVLLSAGAGCSLARLSAMCAEKGYSGLEFTTGIPGTVGGAVVMNAGAWGAAIADVLVGIRVISPDGEINRRRNELTFAYRRLVNLTEHRDWVISQVTFELVQKDADEIQALCRTYTKKRSAVQPSGAPNAGSIFRNPDNDSAGRLIEASGLKGMVVGGAKISEKHANFIVNTDNASASDVLTLMRIVQESVRRNSGIMLEPEVHVL